MYSLEDALAAKPVTPNNKNAKLMAETDFEFVPDLGGLPATMGQALMEVCGDCLEGVGNNELDSRHSGFPVDSVAKAALVPTKYQG